MAEQWIPKQFERGVEQKRPGNVGMYDMIQCKKPVIRIGPDVTICCNKPMAVARLIDTGLEIRRGDLVCNAWDGHNIQSRQMYIAVCKNKAKHIDGEINVVCSVCIENHSIYAEWISPEFDIVKNFYTYKRKK